MSVLGQLPRHRSRSASVRAAGALAALLAAGASVADAQQAPGGVSDQNLFLVWLKANVGTGTTSDNAPVDAWNDQSPVHGDNNAIQTNSTSSRPLFQKDSGSLINFNPALSFDNNNDYLRVHLDVAPPNRNQLSTAIVYRAAQGGGLYGNDNTNWDLAHDTSYVAGNNSNVYYPGGDTAGLPVINGGFFNHSVFNGSSVFINNREVADFTYDNATNTHGYMDIGVTGTPCSNCGTFFGGTIGEFILYSRTLTSQERQRIDSYLAIKYGITLDQAAATNYLDSGAAVIWNATTNRTYRHNITGIGRDDNSALIQRQSRSVQNDSLVTMGLGTIAVDNVSNTNNFTANRTFLVWGNDDRSTSFATPVMSPPGLSEATRMARIWKVQETGSVATVKVGVPLSTGPPGPLYLVVSNDDTFGGSDQWIAMATFSAGTTTYRAADVNFTTGQFFTFATAEPLDFGDAPASYGTLLANDGARHTVEGYDAATRRAPLMLGETIDVEADGQPDATATGDDVSDGDDEDGVVFSPLVAGRFGVANVRVTGPRSHLHVWADWNSNGTFADSELIVHADVDGTLNIVPIFVPVGTAGAIALRFRLSSVHGLGPTGPAPDGEVEDYVVTVGREVELAITKSDGQMAYVPGAAITYTLTVTNAGPSTASGFSIADVVPAAITGVVATCAVTGTGSCGTNGTTGNSVSFTNASLPAGAGQALTITIMGTVGPGTTGNLVNTATVAVGAGQIDTAPANNSATDTDMQGAGRANLAIAKTDGQTGYVAGTPISYTLTVTNAGPSNAAPVSVSDTVPASITGVVASCAPAGTAGCGTNTSTGNNVSFTGASVPAGAGNSLTITISGTVDPGATGNLVNTAHVTVPVGAPYSDPSPANNSATDNNAPGTPQVDLAITKTDGRTTYVPGAVITYTLEVTNAGPSTASGFSVSDAVPPALTGVTATCVVQGLGSCGSPGPAGNNVSFTNATLAPGGGNALSIAITGTVSPATTGALANTATVAAGAGTTEANLANNSATDTDSQGAGLANLAITKTNGQSSYVAGAPVTYTLTITNAGPSHAPAFDVSDAVPAAITGVSVICTPSGTASCGTNGSTGNDVVFTGASLDAGAGHSLTIAISGTISPDADGPLANTAQLTVPDDAGYTDPAPGNNSATDTDTALPQQVDLAITKTDGQTSYVPGATILYTLMVTNAGPSTATDVRVADVVPPAITGVTAHCVATGLARCGTTSAPGNSVSVTNASLPPGVGNHLLITIDGTVSPDTNGDLVNSATVTAAAGAIDTAPANNTATDTDTQGAGVADLLVSKTDGTAVYTPGVPITYQIVVINDGPSHAVGFAIDDVVPAAITGVAASCVVTTGAGICGTNDTVGNTVAFSGVTLTAGSTLTVTVTGTIDPAATGDLSNTATVTVPGGSGFTDPDPTSNTATDIDTPGSQLVDLAITKDDGQTSYVPGTPISYTVTVTNAGPSTATDVSLNDELPAAITNPTATCVATGGANCGSRSAVRSPIGSVGASLPPGTTLTITIAGTIAPDATGDLVNTATVAAGTGATDSNPANNSATDTDTASTPEVDLVVVKDDGQTTYVPGTPISYTITVTNAGPSAANGFSLADTVAAAITGVTVTCAVTGDGSCGTDGSAGNAVSFTNASLAPGPANALTVTVSGTVSPSATGNLVNTATVTAGAASTDTNSGNNTATDIDTAGIAQVDLGITKTDGQDSYVPGTPISYTLTVSNAGPSAANGFTITDVVPPAITGVAVVCVVTGTGGCGVNGSSGNSISFTNASLAAGDGHTLTLTVTGTIAPDAIGALVNTATLTPGAGSIDVNPANDSATDTDTRGAAQVDLAITKTDGQITYVPGTAITYTIVVTNAGPSTATGFSITDAVPAAITGVTATCAATGGGVCGTNGSLRENVVFNNASLPPGAGTLTLTVHGTIGPSTSGEIENTATVTEGVGSVDVNAGNDSATDIDTPGTSQIDLAVTKTDGQTTYVPGAAITYTITVTNTGPSAANGFTVTDTVPAEITGVTATCAVTGMASCGPNGSSSGNAVSLGGLSVAPGAGNAITITVTGTVSPDATGDLINTATVAAGASSTDANTGNNSATDTDTQGVSEVNLAIAKTNNQTAYVPGTPISYTITVTNTGPSTATGVSISDPVPATITGVTITCTATGTDSCGTNASAGNNVSFTGATLAPGAGHALTVAVSGTISPDATGPLVNAATVTAGPGSTDPSPGNNSSTDTDTQGDTQVDLVITKTDGQTTYVPGTPITYTIAVTNAGPSHAGSFTITDLVSAAITGVMTTCAFTGTGGCGTNASSGNTVSFTNASLAPGAGNALTITIDGIVSSGASGTLTNTATVAAVGATDPNPGNNSATDPNSPGTSQANLGITKTGPASVLPGGTVNYTLTVSNAGPSDALDVTVSDPTPTGLIFVSNAGDCTTSFPCTLGPLPVGATRTITSTFDVPSGYTSPAPIVNTATVSSTATDPDSANDSATASTALVRDADVEVTKSAPANVLAGETIDVTVSVLNHGPNGATGVEVTDLLPPGFQFVTDERTQGVYDPGSGIWTVGAVAVGASAQLVITATATEPGSITNSAVKTGQSEPDPNPANDSSGSTTNVAAAADLAIDTSVDRADALVGETVTFTVRATNRGPSAATGVTITETTTPGLTITSATPSQGTTFDAGLWTVGALDASAEATLTVVARLDAAGAQVTNAGVTAQIEIDPNPLNDSDAALVNAAAAADLRVMKAVSNPAPGVGALIAYTVAVTNLGPSAATSAAILDVLPANVSFVAAFATQGTFDSATGIWTVGALPVTATEALAIIVRVTATGDAINTATRQSSAPVDPNPANDGDSASVAPAVIADLAIAKALMTAPIPGQLATYTIVVHNRGPSAVTGATVTDLFPPALLGVSWTCTADAGSVCPASGTGNLAAAIDLERGDRATFTVTGTIASGATGVLTNTAAVAVPAGVTDPAALNNASTSTVPLTPIADMQVTKTGPAQATPGTNISYTITATNAGPSDATGVVLNDVTPPGLTLVSVTGDCLRGFPCPVEPTFVAGASRSFTLTYAVPSGYTMPDPIANTVTVSSTTADPQNGNNEATATTSLGGPVTDLGITKTNGVTTVVPGSMVTYTITVTNAGPTDAVGAVVTDTFPAELTGVTWTCAGTGGGVCSPTGSGSINETVTVPVGGTVVFTVTGTVSAAAVGVLVNTASVAPPPGASDPSSANNTDSDTLTPQADLAITKTGPVSVVAGSNVVYTITVTNAGPSNAEGVVVTDGTPTGLTFVSNSGDCTTAFPCALGTVTTDTPRTITATFAVPLSYTTPDPIPNTATVSTATTDPVTGNDTATVETPLNRNADVEVTKTAPTTVLVGDTVAIAITAFNHGPGAATGVEVTDVLPAGFTYVSSAPDGVYDPVTGVWTVGALALDGQAQLTITATATSPGAITNVAVKTGQNEPDPNPNNDSGGTITSTDPAADVLVVKRVDRRNVLVGETVTFTVRAVNRGPSPATGVVITDALPPGLMLITPTPSQGTYDGSVWTVGSLAAPGVATLTLVAQVTVPGALVNNAAVTGQTEADPDPLNNSDAASVNAAPAADLRVTKAVSDPAPAVGGLVTYTIAVTNIGPSAATGVTITDVLPASVAFVSKTESQGTYDPVSGLWTVGDMAATATQTLSITVRVLALGPVTNTATRQASAPIDPNTLNDSASATATPQLVADLAITKTPSAATVNAGAQLTWTLVVTNAGPSTATSATVTDAFAPVFTGVTWTCTATAGSSCGAASGVGAIATTVTLLASGRATFVASTLIASSAIGPQANTASVTAPAGTTDPQLTNNTATATVEVTASADLQITKTGPASVVPGTDVVYTITITNAGPSDAASVEVTDATPTGLIFVSNEGACTSAFPCALGTVAAGAPPRIITATFAVPATYATPDPIVNTATVSSATPDAVPANNTATVPTAVTLQADLAITKTGPASVVPGTNVVYTITVTNAGPSTAESVVVADLTPAGLTFVSNTGACLTAFPCALGTVPAGGPPLTITATFAVPATYTAPNPIVNTATVSTATADPVPGNNTATVQTSVTPQADLTITKTGPASVVPGTNVVYTITVTNVGPSDAASVVVADVTPAELTFVSNEGACTTAFPCALGLVPAGGPPLTITATFTVPATYTTPDPIVNSATVATATADPVTANNTATAMTPVALQADLTITKTGPTSVVPGTNLVYTITVTNAGPSNAEGVVVDDATPTGLTFVSNTVDCLTAFPCTLGTLPAGATRTITATFAVPLGYTAADPIVNIATVSTTTTDPVPANDTATVATPLNRNADVEVTKTAPQDVLVGDTVAIAITVINHGPGAATGVEVTDVLPAGFTYVSSAPDGVYDPVTGVWTVGALALDGQAQLTITATATSPGAITNVAVKTGQTEPDPNPSNDSGGAITSADPAADVLVVKNVDRSEALVGETVTFTVRAINRGPSPATGVVITDALPPGLTLITPTPSQGTYDGSVWTVGELAVSAEATLTLVASVDATGALVNNAAVTAQIEADPDPLNNSDAASVNAAPAADLRVMKAVSDPAPAVGGLVTYTIAVTNLGPSAATSVTISDVLPASITFESATASQGTYDEVSGLWTVGAMPATGTELLSITGRVTALGAVTNTATRQESAPVDPNSLNDSASAAATPQLVADLAITKTPSAATVAAGAPLTWTIAVTNAGPSTATDATVTDTFAPAFTGVTWTCTAAAGSSCGAASGVGAIATTVTLLSGGRATFVATTLIAASAIGPQANTATVTAPAGTAELQLTNNTVTATVEVTASADVQITKVGPASVVPGTTVVYTITVTSTGPSDAASVVVTDPTPAGLTFVSNAGDCLTAFPCALGTVPPGAPRVITTTFAVPASYTTPDPLVNTATVETATADPVPGNNTATSMTPVALQADLAITKTGPASVVPGTTVVYTITVTNAGPSDAASVEVTDPAPTGLTWMSNEGACTTAFPCVLGTVPAGAPPLVITATFSVPATYTTPDPIPNTASVTTATPDPMPANNTVTATTAVTLQADVSITKTGPPSVVPGTNVVYTITVTNAGPSTAANVVVTDTPPPGLTFVSNAGACLTAFPCALGTLPAGTPQVITATFSVPATYTTPDPVVNTATVASDTADSVPANNTATVQTPIDRQVDLRVTKAGPPSAVPGTAVEYTITVTNAGASDALAVVVDDPAPAGLTWMSNTGDCLTPFPCTLGMLPAGATRTITAAFAIPHDYTTPDPIVNTVTVSSATADAVPGDNTATASTALAPAADIALTKSVDRPAAAIGEAVVFTVTATNEGPSGSTGLQILDSLPAGLSFDSAAPTQGTYDAVSGVWATGAIAAGASAMLTINAHVTGPAPIVNTAVRLVSDQLDPDGANDVAAAAITPLPVADVQIRKTADRTTVPVGEVVTFTVSAVNAGPGDATGVRVVDLLPAGLAFVSAAPSAGTYEASTGTWTLGTLATGGTATLQLVATVADTGAHTNVAQRTAQNEMDPVLLNDMSGVTVNGPSADLQVLKTVRTQVPGVATVGERIQFTVSITNRGPNDATNVRVLDMLPPGLIFAGAVASQGTYISGAGVWDVGALAASGAASLATLTVDADVAEPVALVNTAARLGADQVDPNRLNDRATVTITGVAADLRLALTSEGNPAAVGAALDFVAAFTNVGAAGASGPITVTFSIPVEAPFESADAGWTCTVLGQEVSCVRADLVVAPGAAGQVRIRTRVQASVVGRWVSASVANALDANPANNTATIPLNAPPPAPADVQVTLSATPRALLVGDATALTATVLNAGPSPALATSLTLSVPAGFALEGVEPGAVTCTGTGPVSCLLGDLAVSASAQVTLRLRATAPGLASASASVGTAVDDPDLTNNAATLSLIVGSGSDIDGDRLQDICEALFGLSVGQNDAATDPDGDGLSNLEECLNGTHPRGFHQAYFAEGASGGGFFDATFTVANESATSSASVTIRLVPEAGPSVTRTLSIGVRGRATVAARDLLGEAPVTFSALIESDVPLSSERTMTWDTATRYGSHAEQGLAQPATRWYLAEGSTTEFDLFYLIFNPGATDAIVDVEYLMPGGASIVRTYTAAADRRTTIRVNDVTGVEATDVSAIITSRNGVPIVVERSMYRDAPDRLWAAGDSSAGLTATATTWHLAEGATGTFFDTFVLIANPEAAAAEIEARFRKGDGTVVIKTYTVAPRSRFTIWVDAADPALAATDVATTIVSTNGVGVVVERAMWWPGPADAPALGTTAWSDAHLAAASPVTASRWALADGAQGGAASAETYVLVGNTSAAGGTVQVTLVFDDGSTLGRNLPIAPAARLTVPIGAIFPEAAGRHFSITVESAGPTPLALVVERASYSDAGGVKWSAGTAVAASPMP